MPASDTIDLTLSALRGRPGEREMPIIDTIDPVLPQAGKQEVPVVFCADAHYSFYLAPVVQSIIEHSSPQRHYHIMLFDCGINPAALEALKQQMAPYGNFSLSIIFIQNWLDNHKNSFVEKRHFTSAIYGRLLIPEVCAAYDKVIYADIDIVFTRDIAGLLAIDLADDYIAGQIDIVLETERFFVPFIKNALKDTLCLADDQFYVNSGVLVFNVPAWRKYHLSAKSIDFMRSNNLHLPDQDAINAICKGKIAYLAADWQRQSSQSIRELRARIEAAYKQGVNPAGAEIAAVRSLYGFYHYAGGHCKPWHNFVDEKSDIWWRYAAKTPYFARYITDMAQAAAQRQVDAALAVRLPAKKRLAIKSYKLFGLALLTVKSSPAGKKYYIGHFKGKGRFMKIKYGKENSYIYLFGIKLLTIRKYE